MVLELDRVSKTYFRKGEPVTALEDVSLRVNAGEIVAVLGGRGAGKTTLLRIAAGLERPDVGAVSIGGKRIAGLSDRELTALRRVFVGCVWGSPVSIDRASALDTVALPLRLQTADARSARLHARNALDAIGIGHVAAYELDDLSDGERQLTAVAQALVTRPRLLTLDRPAADLNVIEERSLLDVLDALAKSAGVAILVAVRSANEAAIAHRVASLSDGRLIAGAAAPAEADGDAQVLELPERRSLRGSDSGPRA